MDGPHPLEINDELFPAGTGYIKTKVIAMLESIRAFLRGMPNSSKREYNRICNKAFR